MSNSPHYDELDRRLDAALDALAAEQTPSNNGEDEYMELLDAARLVRRLRKPDLPDEDFAGQLAARLQPLVSDKSQNGRTSDAAISSFVPVARRKNGGKWLLASLAAVLRVLGSGVIAGAIAGILAIGVGGRIAMRISGALYLREHPGAATITDSSGQTVGVVTLSGTIDLLSQAMFAGLLGGLLYIVIRQWLPSGRFTRPIATGGFILCTAGLLFIDPNNQDFTRIGIPWLNVAMFASFVTLFGMLVSPLSEWILKQASELAGARRSRFRHTASAILIYPAGLFGLMLVMMLALSTPILIGAAIFEFVLGHEDRLQLVAIMTVSVLIVMLPLLSVALNSVDSTVPAGGFRDQIRRHQAVLNRTGQIILIAASLAGAILLLYTTLVIVTA